MIFLSSPLQARIFNRLGMLPLLRVGYKHRILGSTFKIPIIENKEGLIYHLGVGEPYLLEVFRQLYEARKFTFLDAGVNFGQTLLKVKAVCPDAPYIGFEPSGLCSYYASLLIKVNRLTDSKLIRCALSDKPGVLTLFSQSEGDTRATIIENSIVKGEDIFHEIVPAITLDSLMPTITDPGKDIILKVDVEGAEWMVFEGGKELLQGYRPIVIFENLPSGENQDKQAGQHHISDFFRNNSFELFLLDEENNRLEKAADINNKLNYSTTNYLAIPAEKIQWFPKLFRFNSEQVQQPASALS